MSIQFRFMLLFGAIVLATFFISGYLLWHAEERHFQSILTRQIHIISHLAESSRQYVSHALRPALNKQTPEFLIEGNSGTVLTTCVFRFFQEKQLGYHYRQAALSPLNPENLASPWEQEVIRSFQNNSAVSEQSGFYKTGGREHYFMARPVRVTSSCLTCHGNPEQAPRQLLERYPADKNGYHWMIGEIVGAAFVSVPTQELRDSRQIRLTIVLIGLLGGSVVIMLGVAWLFRRVISQPMYTLLHTMNLLAENPTSSVRFDWRNNDEIGALSRGFNRMADNLRDFHLRLEGKVAERTRELAKKEQLQMVTEQAFARLERQNHKMLESVGEGIYGVDIDGYTTFINQTALDLLGFEREELLGKQQHTIIHYSYPDGSEYPIESCPIFLACQNGETHHVAHEVFWRKDGTGFPVEYTSTPILDDGQIHGSVVVFRDVTEKQLAERRTEQSNAFQRVINQIYAVSFTSKPLNEQLTVALEAILSIPWLVIQSKGAIFLVDPNSGSDLMMVAQKGLANPLLTLCNIVPFGHCLCGRSAQDRKLLFSACVDQQHDIRFEGMQPHGHYVVPLQSGKHLLGILTLYINEHHTRSETEEEMLNGLANSISGLIQQQRSEETLLCHNAELEQRVHERTLELQGNLDAIRNYQDQLVRSERMAALGSLVAGLSHEINTPIGIAYTASTHFQSQLRILSQKYREKSLSQDDFSEFLVDSQSVLGMILQNLSRTNDLIASFKNVAVDQSSQEKRVIQVADYLGQIILSLRPKLKNLPHEVSIRCPDNLEWNTWPGALSQIVTNLLINSLVHGLDKDKPGKIWIEVIEDDNQIVVEYGDDGKGMEPANVKQIFEPFFTTCRNNGGSGLGMHVTFNLVTQKMGGSIQCHSTIGKGITFRMTFQLDSQEREK